MIIVSDGEPLADVQGSPAEQAVGVNRVGISDLKLPLLIADRAEGTQQVVANAELGVNLTEDQRGAHLSRFIELAEKYRQSRFSLDSVEDFLHEMRSRLNSTNAYARFDFDYFVSKLSPTTDKEALVDFNCGFGGILQEDETKIWIRTEVPLTSLCPCSKTISESGAHNQRALVKSKAVIDGLLWLEEMIELVEAEGSSQVYSLLKREDEAYLTNEAYNNPKFVEDIARDLSVKFNQHEKIKDFQIECKSFESIHNHNAFASVTNGEFWKSGGVV